MLYTVKNIYTPFCVPILVSCPTRSDPDSGNITISSYGLLTRASYACTTGYRLFGEAESECLSNGSWSYNEPRCGKFNWFRVAECPLHNISVSKLSNVYER